MKGFKLTSDGDIQLTGGIIDMIDGDELTAQKCRTVLGTNKGEWFMNGNEGISFSSMLGKNITEDMQRSQIELGLRQVDDTFSLTEFSREFDNRTRRATIKFTATNKETVTVTGEQDYE